MKRTVKLLNLILAAAILLSACAQAAKPTPAPQAAAVTKIPAQPTATTAAAIPTKAPQQVQVTEADQGKNFMLSPGDSLIVVLDSNPSTGYTWVVKPVDNPVLAQAGEPVFKADSEKLGASGKTTLTLKSVAAGSQVLTLLYQRSFEKDTQPAKTFTVNVTVSSSASTQPTFAIPNPAAKYCTDQGFKSEIRTAADGSQFGVCKFPDGKECNEWAYFRGECKPGQ